MLPRTFFIVLFALVFNCTFFTYSAFCTTLPDSGKGVIKETMDASGYTYLQLETDNGTIWVAIPQTKVKVGDEVTYLDGMTMTNFHSNTLDRNFEQIIFSSGLAEQSPTPQPAQSEPEQVASSSFAEAVASERDTTPAQEQQQVSGGSLGATVPYMETTVEKVDGDNGYTVEEIFTKAKDLDGKQVHVRGKIVKFSPNIMGRNWVHIQDGTGNPMNNTHDLVVTTHLTVEVGQTTTFSGTLAAGKDFGYGYKYEALLEEASLIQ